MSNCRGLSIFCLFTIYSIGFEKSSYTLCITIRNEHFLARVPCTFVLVSLEQENVAGMHAKHPMNALKRVHRRMPPELK